MFSCIINREFLERESLGRRGINVNWKGWHFHSKKDIPQQDNGVDCGVFMLQVSIYSRPEWCCTKFRWKFKLQLVDKGHFGTSRFVLSEEVILFSEAKNELHERGPVEYPLLRGCQRFWKRDFKSRGHKVWIIVISSNNLFIASYSCIEES